jgi:hypothetical protein
MIWPKVCLAMVPNCWDETRSFSQRKITDEICDFESQATYSSAEKSNGVFAEPDIPDSLCRV